ncbi:hypothetical protein WQ54_17650 [Bacillus sp. SA1-12]|uniref:hypothetical protein n=1 Tax=Bacillus sp. SA1-12 TaxID=1455638 RepID=UPI00062737EF|nr:hypothetical protein [Bacillus sp. SA1-12]KKI90968.1 hypothetical protein WQ54_17650 [Bacillus sp. SA1-12]
MIYYLFNDKERMQLEDLLKNEINVVKDLLSRDEGLGNVNWIKIRALQERNELLLGLLNKISR